MDVVRKRGADMTLEEVIEFVRDHIDERWGKTGCHLCRANSWTLAEDYTRLELSKFGRTAEMGNRALPCIAIVCTNCGNTILLNMKVLGLEHG